MTFDDFHKALIADERWYETMQMIHKYKPFKEVCLLVYGTAVGEGTLVGVDIKEHRNHVHNKLAKTKVEIKNVIQTQQEEVKAEEEKPRESVPYEVHQKRLDDWLKSIAEIPALKKVPRLSSEQIKEEGQWEPKKENVYHPDDAAVIRHRYKIEYARQFSNPMSHEGRLLPGSPTFEDWMEQQITLANLKSGDYAEETKPEDIPRT